MACFTYMDFPYKCKGVYIQLIGLKGSNRKYKRDDKMRASMPSDKSVPFLLASVAMEETETAYRGKIHQWKFWR